MPAAVGPASEAGREQPREGLHPSEVAADVENQRRVTPALQMLRPLGVRKNRPDVAEHPAPLPTPQGPAWPRGRPCTASWPSAEPLVGHYHRDPAPSLRGAYGRWHGVT